MLTVEGVRVSYGGSRALDGVELTVGANEFVAIVGPNGAGKTTLFRAISGVVPLESGRVLYDGRDLASVAPTRGRRLASRTCRRAGRCSRACRCSKTSRWARSRPRRGATGRRARSSCSRCSRGSPSGATQAAGTLSGGEQQMVAIARGLASKPRLLMLDEPSMGLAPMIADEIFECVERIHRERSIAILLVEQRVAEAIESCDCGYVLESGRIVLAGTHDSLMSDARVKKAYLGL